MKKLSLPNQVILMWVFTILIESCAPSIAPTLTPTSAPTLTPTFAPTETPITPTVTPGPPSELAKANFKSSIDEITDTELKEEWQRLSVAFPNAEIYMTDRGEICVTNVKDLVLCGQVLRGSSGTTFTYLMTPIFHWELRVYMQITSKDDLNVLNSFSIPDLVNNTKKDEIIRIAETLLDIKERVITTNEDLAVYQSDQEPRHLIAIFAGIEEEPAITDFLIKEVFRNYEGSEHYFKDPNSSAGRNNPAFWDTGFGHSEGDTHIQDIVTRMSRVVQAPDGTFIYAHFESRISKDTPGQPFGQSIESAIGGKVLLLMLEELIRDYLNTRAEMTNKTFTNPRSSSIFKHLFDNYPPINAKYWEEAHADGIWSEEEEAAAVFYVSDMIEVRVDSFLQIP